jgi:hypothetical protein
MENTEKKMSYLVRAMPKKMHQNLKIKAAVLGISMQALLLQIISEYLEK